MLIIIIIIKKWQYCYLKKEVWEFAVIMYIRLYGMQFDFMRFLKIRFEWR